MYLSEELNLFESDFENHEKDYINHTQSSIQVFKKILMSLLVNEDLLSQVLKSLRNLQISQLLSEEKINIKNQNLKEIVSECLKSIYNINNSNDYLDSGKNDKNNTKSPDQMSKLIQVVFLLKLLECLDQNNKNNAMSLFNDTLNKIIDHKNLNVDYFQLQKKLDLLDKKSIINLRSAFDNFNENIIEYANDTQIMNLSDLGTLLDMAFLNKKNINYNSSSNQILNHGNNKKIYTRNYHSNGYIGCYSPIYN